MKNNASSKKKPVISNIIMIYKNLKEIFCSKDKEKIGTALGKILYTLFLTIMIKIPFIFFKTILLDSLNINNISYIIQNIISACFEISYFFVAIVVIYKYLKKYFAN
ncbi:MAG: hypothetical protein IJN03_02020 [Bacilli bacterium]|nr:hypothetical protein [Bacilli bacterium]